MFRSETIETRTKGPVTCEACGCRLEASSGARDGEYRHFGGGLDGRDARGCTVECVGLVHDATGTPVRAPLAA